MTALPTDILREIGAYWHGHHLAYTCTALYAGWNHEDYLIAESKAADTGSITTSRMPNGAYHGECVAVQDGFTEIVTYDRGRLVSVSYDESRRFHAVDILVNGWLCRWMRVYSANYLLDCDIGSVSIVVMWENNTDWSLPQSCESNRDEVALRDFTAVAHEMAGQLDNHGNTSSLYVSPAWGGALPQTRCG